MAVVGLGLTVAKIFRANRGPTVEEQVELADQELRRQGLEEQM